MQAGGRLRPLWPGLGRAEPRWPPDQPELADQAVPQADLAPSGWSYSRPSSNDH